MTKNLKLRKPAQEFTQTYGWSPRTIVRRVRYNADELKKNSRSRRRRTVDPDQLTLLENNENGLVI